jgi:hypothetical protein
MKISGHLNKSLILIVILFLSISVKAQNVTKIRGFNGKYGFYDKNGELVVDYIYDNVLDYNEDMAKVKLGEYFGYVDKDGKLVINCLYEFATYFHNGLAKVYKDDEIAYINKQGEIVRGWYSYLGAISKEIAIIKKDEKYAFINDESGEMIGNWYDYVQAFDNDGLALVREGKDFFYINKKGETVKSGL